MWTGTTAHAGVLAVAATSAALQSAAICRNLRRHPYERALAENPVGGMDDISGHPFADGAIVLGGVNLSLGRGAARVHILRDVSLNIGRGEAVGLLGPSGSGKSTLLMVMTGLERPDSGSVTVAGEDLGRLDEDGLARFRCRAIGIVFQSFHLIPTMTALENVAIPLELAGAPTAQSRAERELAALGLSGRLHHYPAELSGGEQQRVALARALAPNPAILVADEPTGNLDETTGRDIMELLFRGHRERGTTLVLVTHDNELAARCDRVLQMHSGRIATTSAPPRVSGAR
jgi:putative ABC transport system ATP-binding protein